MSRIRAHGAAAIAAPAGVVVLLAHGFLALGRHTVLVNLIAGLGGVALVASGMTEPHVYVAIPTLFVGWALCAVPVIGMTHRGRALIRRLRGKAEAAARAAGAAAFPARCAAIVNACGWTAQPATGADVVATRGDVSVCLRCVDGTIDQESVCAIAGVRAAMRAAFAAAVSTVDFTAPVRRDATAMKVHLLRSDQIAAFLGKVDAWAAGRRLPA